MPGKGIQRVGDISTGGGINVGPGVDDIQVNGRPIAAAFDLVTPHMDCSYVQWWHCICFVTGLPGSKSVKANGQSLVLDGDYDTCMSHKRTLGSNNVKAV